MQLQNRKDCIDVLKNKISFMALSIGAFADKDFYKKQKKSFY